MENLKLIDKSNYARLSQLENELSSVLMRNRDLINGIAQLLGDARFNEFCAAAHEATRAMHGMMDVARNAQNTAMWSAESRGMKKLVAICANRMLRLPAEIERKTKQIVSRRRQFKAKLDDLTARGYTEEQITQMIGDEESLNEAAYQAEIDALNREVQALQRFTSDFPRYDQSVLIGTRFENWTLETHQDYLPVQVG